MLNKFALPMLIITFAVLAGLLTWTNSTIPVRSAVLFLFISVVPGLAITRLFKIGDFLTEIVLAIGLSLVTSTILAEIMVFTHLWSPDAEVTVLVGVSILAAILQIVSSEQLITQRGS